MCFKAKYNIIYVEVYRLNGIKDLNVFDQIVLSSRNILRAKARLIDRFSFQIHCLTKLQKCSLGLAS